MVEAVDPNSILFSLPPCAKSLPPGPLARHEDDWRQIEFVPSENSSHIEAELVDLATFIHVHRQGGVWSNLPSEGAPHPAREPRPDRLKAAKTPGDPLAIRSQGVIGGFALVDVTGGWLLYGQQSREGHIVNLALSPGAGARTSPEFAQAISQLGLMRNLILRGSNRPRRLQE